MRWQLLIVWLLVGLASLLTIGRQGWWLSRLISHKGVIKDTILLRDGQMADDLAGSVGGRRALMNEDTIYETEEVMVTNGVKHTVPLNEVIGGGPPKDGIPSIDEPKFLTVDEVDFLSEEEPGVAVSLNGVDRFYPFQILVWHEIVNDVFPDGKEGKQRVLVSYCPLCLSGIVFDPVVQGERVEFGTSGKLWQSNLVMYDRQTNSLWSQLLGEAIVGEMAGSKLKVLPSDQVKFGRWRRQYPQGQVLSRDTGARRFYGRDPYGDYYQDNAQIISKVGVTDDRLDNKDFVLGVVFDDQAKAYYPPTIKAKGRIEDAFAGRVLVVEYESDIDVVRIFEKKNDRLTRINPRPTFWFSWVAAHPDTELFK